jgi:succinyl-diaminopimelate desuccinylase
MVDTDPLSYRGFRLTPPYAAPSMPPALAQRTLELVDIPSVSRDEAAALAYVAAEVPLPLVHSSEGAQLYAAARIGKPLVLLAGHVDTVPEQGNLPGRIEDGWVVGLGASDMKGGVAVMIELARWVAGSPELPFEPAFLFFAREELALEESPLPEVFAQAPLVHEAELVLVLEPTDNALHLGCLGSINASLAFHGRSAHSARPWQGENAIAKAVAGLAPVVAVEPHDIEVAGLTFTEVLTVTQIHGGVADNVVPDRVTARLNYRYAPGRSPEDAEARLRELAPGVEIHTNSPAAHIPERSPLLDRLQEIGGFERLPKQAWTPVAQFAAEGLDAVNLGPGATRYAHQRDERVEIAELERTYDALRRFLSG